MNISAPFINRPVTTTLLMAAILFFGIYAFKSLPVSDLPNIDYPTITVTASQPGGSPEYMANLIATPLERNLATISGLNTMSSNNTLGQTQIVLNFSLDVDLNSKEVEVQAAITQTLPDLPPLPSNPTYEKQNPSDTPILYLALTTSSLTLADLYDIGYNILAQPLSMVTGVSQVQVYGNPYAVRVQADPMKLMAHQIDLNGLATALINSNPNLPSGTLQGRYRDFLIQSFGMLTTGKEYDNVVINQDKGNPLYVSNVAESISALDQRDPYFHYLTNEADKYTVVLAISRLPGSNTINISNDIFNKLPILEKSIPAAVSLTIFYNKAEPIIQSVNDVEYTLLVALVLVIAVIFIYLGRIVETLIPSVTLPMSIVATFIIMFWAGFSLDNLSLLALTLAIGFIVDDSIVVLENIVRHLEMGKTPYDAAIDGSKQISITVLTMTLALSAVFIPFIWMPGTLGRIFHEFSLTIIIAILCSGFISLTLNPMLCSRFLTPHNKEKEKPNLSERMNTKLVSWYEWLLLHSIRYKFLTLIVGLSCIALTFLMLKVLPGDFLPPGNSNLIQGLVKYQQGSSKHNSIIHQMKLNDQILQNSYQTGLISIAGYPTDDQGAIFIHLKDSERPSATKISHDLFTKLNAIPGVNIFLRPYPLINLQIGNPTSLGDYQYTLVCTDSNTLYPSSEEFIKRLKEIPEIIGINSDLRIKSPQLNLTIDRDRAGIYGITAEEIESTLQYAYSGGRISTFNKGINLYDLILEVQPGYDLLVEDLDLLYIKASTGELVPLTSVASWREVAAPSSINHTNTFPSVTISFNLAQGAALSTVLKKIDTIAKEILPSNVVGSVQGSGQVFIQTFKAMKWLFIVAIIVIYILLGILYESFIHPLTILSALPVATLGGLLTLWIFNQPLSLYSVVALIVLIGLVQKNGIMMIDFALEYARSPGVTPLQAIIEASKVRFRPILMTTLAAMMGALPIAFGSDMNRVLGMVVFGGLIFSQLITLFVTPVVFLYMQNIQDYYDRKFANKKFQKNDVTNSDKKALNKEE